MDLMVDAQGGSFETHKAEGEKLYRQGEYKKSLDSFSTALVLKYDDKNCLVARSKCFLQLGDAEKALTDAEAALKLEKKFTKGLYQKAEALYAMGDFEFALVFYHRGHKLRPELEEFRLGIQKAQEAIDNCVGSPEKIKLETTGDLSFFNTQEPKPKVKTQPSSPVRTSRKVSLRETSSTLRRSKKGAVAEKTVKQLLGELYSDKSYLERLLNDEDISTASACNEQIRGLVNNCLDYLDSRAEFWRCQKPLYAREREKLEAKEGKGADTTKFILQALEDIDKVQTEGNYEESLTRARQVLTSSRNWNESDVHNKHEIVGSLHNFMGVAYLELGRYDRALKDHQMDYDIAVKHGLPDSKSRALDNIGRCYAKMGQFSKAIASWQEKEGMCKSAMERTWVTHEIGRCYLELANYEKSYKYGNESYEAAKEAGDEVWQLNTSVLLAQSQAKLGDLAAAASTFEQSLRHAENCDDAAATVAIGKALTEIRSRLDAKAAVTTAPAAPTVIAESASTEEPTEEAGGDGGTSDLQPEPHEITLLDLNEVVEDEAVNKQLKKSEKCEEEEEKDKEEEEMSRESLNSVNIPAIRTQAATPTLQESSEEEMEEEEKEETVNKSDETVQEEENKETVYLINEEMVNQSIQVEHGDLAIVADASGEEQGKDKGLEGVEKREKKEVMTGPEETKQEDNVTAKLGEDLTEEENEIPEGIHKNVLQQEIKSLLTQLFNFAAGDHRNVDTITEPSALLQQDLAAETHHGNLVVEAEEDKSQQIGEEIKNLGSKQSFELSQTALSSYKFDKAAMENEDYNSEQISHPLPTEKRESAISEPGLDGSELMTGINQAVYLQDGPFKSNVDNLEISSNKIPMDVALAKVEPEVEIAVDKTLNVLRDDDSEIIHLDHMAGTDKDKGTNPMTQLGIEGVAEHDAFEDSDADKTISSGYDEHFDEEPGSKNETMHTEIVMEDVPADKGTPLAASSPLQREVRDIVMNMICEATQEKIMIKDKSPSNDMSSNAESLVAFNIGNAVLENSQIVCDEHADKAKTYEVAGGSTNTAVFATQGPSIEEQETTVSNEQRNFKKETIEEEPFIAVGVGVVEEDVTKSYVTRSSEQVLHAEREDDNDHFNVQDTTADSEQGSSRTYCQEETTVDSDQGPSPLELMDTQHEDEETLVDSGRGGTMSDITDKNQENEEVLKSRSSLSDIKAKSPDTEFKPVDSVDDNPYNGDQEFIADSEQANSMLEIQEAEKTTGTEHEQTVLEVTGAKQTVVDVSEDAGVADQATVSGSEQGGTMSEQSDAEHKPSTTVVENPIVQGQEIMVDPQQGSSKLQIGEETTSVSSKQRNFLSGVSDTELMTAVLNVDDGITEDQETKADTEQDILIPEKTDVELVQDPVGGNVSIEDQQSLGLIDTEQGTSISHEQAVDTTVDSGEKSFLSEVRDTVLINNAAIIEDQQTMVDPKQGSSVSETTNVERKTETPVGESTSFEDQQTLALDIKQGGSTSFVEAKETEVDSEEGSSKSCVQVEENTEDTEQRNSLSDIQTSFVPKMPEGRPNKGNSRRASLLRRISLSSNKVHPSTD